MEGRTSSLPPGPTSSSWVRHLLGDLGPFPDDEVPSSPFSAATGELLGDDVDFMIDPNTMPIEGRTRSEGE